MNDLMRLLRTGGRFGLLILLDNWSEKSLLKLVSRTRPTPIAINDVVSANYLGRSSLEGSGLRCCCGKDCIQIFLDG